MKAQSCAKTRLDNLIATEVDVTARLVALGEVGAGPTESSRSRRLC